MSPTSLLNVPTDMLCEHVSTRQTSLPAAAAADRFWAGVTCLGLMTLLTALYAVLH